MSRRVEARIARQRARRRSIIVAAGTAVPVVLVAALVAVGRGADDSSVRVSMSDFAFDPDPVSLGQGERRLTIVNDGLVAHDFVVPELGKGTPDLPPGGEMVLDLSQQPTGTYEVICDLPGHREAGMVTEITLR